MNQSKVAKQQRIRSVPVSIESPNGGGGVAQFQVNLNVKQEKVIQVRLKESLLVGTPIVGGVPVYDYYTIVTNPRIDAIMSNDRKPEGLRLYITGERTSKVYEDRVLLDGQSPVAYQNLTVSLFRPDGSPALDWTRLVLQLEFVYDIGAAGWQQ